MDTSKQTSELITACRKYDLEAVITTYNLNPLINFLNHYENPIDTATDNISLYSSQYIVPNLMGYQIMNF